MRRVAAGRIITAMTDKQPFWNWSYTLFVGNTMRIVAFPINPYTSISVACFCPCSQPTCIGGLLVHVLPELVNVHTCLLCRLCPQLTAGERCAYCKALLTKEEWEQNGHRILRVISAFSQVQFRE